MARVFRTFLPKKTNLALFSQFLVVPQRSFRNDIGAFMKPFSGTAKKNENTSVYCFFPLA